MALANNNVLDGLMVDEQPFMDWLGKNNFYIEPLSRGEYEYSLEQLQLRYICEDPVLWCKAFMKEPDTGKPYSFWDYQEQSARSWQQDVIHQDGAEVGKTREITALTLWGMCTGFGYTIKNPSILIAAPQQTHLDEIIMDIEKHVGEGDAQEKVKPVINQFWLKPKKHPHTMFKFKSPTCTPGQVGLVYFRPAGHDGEAFRGVHVSALGLFDESAKIKNKVCWSEFFRALKPGAKTRIYSVPDGDNTTNYYSMSKSAIEDLPNGEPGRRLFHWPKTLMPAPFWDDDRKNKFIRDFNGKNTGGYQRNVLGLHGQQENPVWPWELINANVQHVPEYRCIKVRIDKATDTANIEAYRVSEPRIDKSAHTEFLADREDDLVDLGNRDNATRQEAILNLLREFIEPIDNAVLWGGADLGFSKDPTEIMVWREVGHEMRRILRIQLMGVDYPTQCDFIYCIDKLFNFNAQWGVDFGNAGTTVVQILQDDERYDEGNYSERLTGFLFGSALDAIDESGAALEQENDKGDFKSIRMPAKELATNLITMRMQNNAFVTPADSDILNHYQNHTAKEGARNRIFSKKDDHTIDADRVMMLRKAFNDFSSVDTFSSGVYVRGVA